MSVLFTPIKIGDIELKNRIIMSPLTRCRSSEGRVPNDLMLEYYTQRAGAGLIISEATSISPMGVGYPDTPGIWSDAQVHAWKKITDAVHAKEGKIFLQLWHVGRLSDPIFLDGRQPVSASAIAADGHPSLVRPIKPYDTPRALTIDEIKQTIQDYKQAAINALEAGFDGVELHAANGYLVDQFLQDNSNIRTDEYGGSLVNRAKFLFEVTDALIEVWGANRVGIHLAPRCDAQSMGDSDPLTTFTYVAKELGKRKVAFICSRAVLGDDDLASKLKTAFGGVYIINQGLTKDSAEQAINNHHADAAAFGSLYIANPDLVHRFELNSSLNAPKPELFHGGDEKGYTDYPFLD